ncbi:MAG: M42 family metallopeptidase [Planctomycetota bacterium]|jgi:endoglucanase|nr:M42 family metallopeptidase [Planctomycetota bacterium]
MDNQARQFLFALLNAPTPSGYEQPGQALVEKYLRPHAESIRRDVHGNLHAVVNPGGKFRVMLSGHCDELGLMVMHIDEKGFLYVASVGGVYIPLLQGERLVIHSAKGPVPGVIGVKPVHLMDAKEREAAVTKMQDLWVDIGAKDRAEAEELVELGDVATIDRTPLELPNQRLIARGLDDRIGVYAVAEALRLVAREKPAVAVHMVSSVQEEIGLRGAHTAAFAIEPHLGVAVDVGFATDFPNANPKQVGEASLGGGPILHRGPNFNPIVYDRLARAAKEARIKVQLQPIQRASGTDANAIQLSRSGVAAALVSIPCRYMHSPAEMISLKDADNAARLLARFILRLKGNERLIP